MLVWLLGVNLIYSFLARLLFPELVYVRALPILVSLVLIFLSLDLAQTTNLTSFFKEAQKHTITFLWFLILIGLGILLYSVGFGVYTLVILLVMNLALFFISFLIGYEEGKQVFLRGLVGVLVLIGLIRVKEGG